MLYTLVSLAFIFETSFNPGFDVNTHGIFLSETACEARGEQLMQNTVQVRINPDGRRVETHRGVACIEHGFRPNVHGELTVFVDINNPRQALREFRSVSFPKFNSVEQCQAARGQLHLLEVTPRTSYRDRVIVDMHCAGENDN